MVGGWGGVQFTAVKLRTEEKSVVFANHQDCRLFNGMGPDA